MQATTVQAADVPAGPYRKVCFDITVKGATLEANCFLKDDRQRVVRLDDFAECTAGSITFDAAAAALTCRFPFTVPSGPYTTSCKKAEVLPRVLTAECLDRTTYRTTIMRLSDWRDCEPDTIQNTDGALRCTRKFQAPQGTYTQTCDAITRDAPNVMSASCLNMKGVRTRTALRLVEACKPGTIRNEDGRLVCDYDGLPLGAYMARCDTLNAVTDEGVPSLKGTCRPESGPGLTETTLYNIGDCAPDSVVVGKDGRLGCTSRTVGRPVPPPGPYLAECRKTWWQADGMLRIGCPQKDGGIRIDVMNVLECQDNTVEIDHGVAVCTLKSGARSIVDGSYKLSCKSRWMEGDTLVAKCNNPFGSIFLPHARDCKPGSVSLMAGRLVCTLPNGRSTDVDGPYKKECETSALRRDNSLTAWCKKREFTLAGADRCEPNTIALLAGELMCRTRTQAPGIPTGRYTEACYAPKVADGVLSALCPVDAGNYQAVRLSNVGRCEAGSIDFTKGSLVCRYLGMGSSIPDGPYQDLCVEASMREDGALTARCNTGRSQSMHDGRPTAVLRNWQACKPGTIDVDHGNLFCTYTNGELSIPAGDYRQRCLDLRVEDGALKGRCETGAVTYANGKYPPITRESVLHEVNNCRSGTVQVDQGLLGCTYDKGWQESVPAGEYRQSCRGLAITAAGGLVGRCYDKAGAGGAVTSLPQVALCQPGTVEVRDLKLRCLYPEGTILAEHGEGPFQSSCQDIKIDKTGRLTAQCLTPDAGPRAASFDHADRCAAGSMQFTDGRLWCSPSAALGSFGESCSTLLSDADTLEGTCARGRDDNVTTTLDLVRTCAFGSIRNTNGRLTCQRDPAKQAGITLADQARGPFAETCSEIAVTEAGRLTARCTGANGTPVPVTFTDVRHCVPGSLDNKDGQLRCRPLATLGSFVDSCSAMLTGADTLEGTCVKGRDDTATTLDLVRTCVPGSIDNANGRLTCQRDPVKQAYEREEPFRDVCKDIKIGNDGRLTARCLTQHAGMSDVSFDRVNLCAPGSMQFKAGRVWCSPSSALGSFSDSCSTLLSDADTLDGTCAGGRHRDVATTLDRVSTCAVGSIGNADGTLTCQRDPAKQAGIALADQARGPFAETCSEVAVTEAGRLTARCIGANGTPAPLTFTDLRNCVPGSLDNKDGQLQCQPLATLGSFIGSCSAVLTGADTLEGTCKTGGWRTLAAKLDRVGTCVHGSVGNSDGRLECARRPE